MPPRADRKRGLFRRLWRDYLRPYWPRMGLATVLMVIEGSTLALLSWMLKPLFDRVFVGRDESAIWWVGGIIFGLFLIRATTLVITRALLTSVQQGVAVSMQTDLLRHILTLDGSFYQKNPPGALIERIQGDTQAIQGIWTTFISGAGRDVISLVSLFGVAIAIDPLVRRMLESESRARPVDDAFPSDAFPSGAFSSGAFWTDTAPAATGPFDGRRGSDAVMTRVLFWAGDTSGRAGVGAGGVGADGAGGRGAEGARPPGRGGAGRGAADRASGDRGSAGRGAVGPGSGDPGGIRVGGTRPPGTRFGGIRRGAARSGRWGGTGPGVPDRGARGSSFQVTSLGPPSSGRLMSVMEGHRPVPRRTSDPRSAGYGVAPDTRFRQAFARVRRVRGRSSRSW